MKQIRFCFLFLFFLLCFTACQGTDDFPEQAEQDIRLEDLQDTANFRPGALAHILEGEINGRGQAVGFHYEGLQSSKGKVIPGTETKPDKYGIYVAKVMIQDVEKVSNGGKSTFFPKKWTPQDVVDAINEAYDQKSFLTGNTYAGLTEEGIEIRMYLDDHEKIISAFPVYEEEFNVSIKRSRIKK